MKVKKKMAGNGKRIILQKIPSKNRGVGRPSIQAAVAVAAASRFGGNERHTKTEAILATLNLE